MTAEILMGPGAGDPRRIWPGHVHLDQAGVELAVEMLDELESTEHDADGVALADRCDLEDCWRCGKPFRNIVAEYLERASAAGPEAQAAFCAVLSDIAAMQSRGLGTSAQRYVELFRIE